VNEHRKQIAHLDLDCFFVSVERIADPSLIGKPVIVGGSATGRGVVASASYEARAFGVHSAMPTARALKLCPSLIVVRGRHDEYGRLSQQLYERLCELAPVVERASIDELYMDFTGCERLYGNDLPGFMRTIQSLVRKEFLLPCTIALASNKTVAKIAVNTVKPAGVCIVSHGTEAAFLAPLKIGVIPGVGAKTEEMLRRKGFAFVADLQRKTAEELESILGAQGLWIHEAANGGGPDEIGGDRDAKSISREETFARDLSDRKALEGILFTLVEDVCSTLRGNEWKARTITLKLRYADFKTITHAMSVEPTNEDPAVFRAVRNLLAEAYTRRMAIRLVGVRLSNFEELRQLDLELFPTDQKKQRILRTVDAIRNRFGDGVIHVGSSGSTTKPKRP
jgi:DNA polymerase IV